jgi:hypothetical protein
MPCNCLLGGLWNRTCRIVSTVGQVVLVALGAQWLYCRAAGDPSSTAVVQASLGANATVATATAAAVVPSAAMRLVGFVGGTVASAVHYVDTHLIEDTIRQMYFRGPSFLGCWEGRPLTDICSHLTTLPAHYWESNPALCYERATQRIDGIALVVRIAIYAYVALVVVRGVLHLLVSLPMQRRAFQQALSNVVDALRSRDKHLVDDAARQRRRHHHRPVVEIPSPDCDSPSPRQPLLTVEASDDANSTGASEHLRRVARRYGYGRRNSCDSPRVGVDRRWPHHRSRHLDVTDDGDDNGCARGPLFPGATSLQTFGRLEALATAAPRPATTFPR